MSSHKSNLYKFNYYKFRKYLSTRGIDYIIFLQDCGFNNPFITNQRLTYRSTIHKDIINMLERGLRKHKLDTNIVHEMCYNISEEEYRKGV